MANKSGGKPSDRRAGKRKSRSQWVGQRMPELGYYLIMTDTKETGKNCFEGLRDSMPTELKGRLTIKAEKAKTVELVEKALELVGKESQYRIPWIVFDRGQVKGFDEIIWTAEKSGVHTRWSNPCFEIWMYAYFREMLAIRESYTCCDRFADKFKKIIRQKYHKNDRDVCRKLVQCSDFGQAVALAERSLKRCVEDGKKLPLEMRSVYMVQRLVAEMLKKIN